MPDHAKPRIRARNTYTQYLRPRRLIQDAIATKSGVLPTDVRKRKARAASATIIKLSNAKPDIVDAEIENYILLENQKLHKHESLKHNRRRRSLFGKTVNTPYRHKTTETPYKQAVKLELKPAPKPKAIHHRRRKTRHTALKLAMSCLLLLTIGGLGALFSQRTDTNNTLTNVILYDEDMTVSGAPLDISESPQVLGSQITPNKPDKVPAKLAIPALSITSDITPVGLHPNGTLAQPENKRTVGWYRASAPPGVDSAMLLTAYRDSSSPLNQVATVKNGDLIEIVDVSGQSFWYKVTSLEFYAAGEVPMNELVSINKGDRLIIVTSNGEWDAVSKKYNERIVVVAEPAK